jgi:hypothetical protein
MSCSSPKVYSQPYMIPGGAPSTSNDRYSLIHISDEPSFAAIELDCSSEIDCCIVKHQGGFAYLAVGAPAIGPLAGPLDVMPWRRVLPYGPEVQGYTADPLLTSPPIIAVKVHFDMPPAFQGRRAPTVRSVVDTATVGAYTVAGEFPLYGFRRARLSLTAVGASVVYKVEGLHYRSRVLVTEQAANPISVGTAPTSSQLVLDGTGAVERTVAAAATEALDITDEPFDTVMVSVKQGSGAGTAKLLWRAEGDA